MFGGAWLIPSADIGVSDFNNNSDNEFSLQTHQI